MRKLMIAIAVLGMAVLFGTSKMPTLAADAGNYSKLPEAVTTPSLQLIGGYKYCDYNGCYYCQRRECDEYYYSYGKKYCKHYSYYDCSSYGGGGGGGGGGY